MNINQLIYFVEVYENTSITAAAKKLYVSQPAISKAIKELEEEYNIILFTRKNNQIYITENAKFFYKLIKPLIENYQNVEEKLKEYTNKNITLALGMPPMLGTFLFPSILNSFSNKNKGFNFKIKEFGSFANQKAILNGEIDIAFTVIYEGKIDSNLEYIKLGTTELLFAVNKKNPLAKKENITLKELENYPIILMKEDSLQYQLVNQMFNKENINPDIVLTSNQLYIIKELLSNERNNYGAFIFKMLIKENDDIIGISLDKKIMLDVIICYKKGTNLSAKTKRFINFVKNNVSL